jgi:hypothetical protein
MVGGKKLMRHIRERLQKHRFMPHPRKLMLFVHLHALFKNEYAKTMQRVPIEQAPDRFQRTSGQV